MFAHGDEQCRDDAITIDRNKKILLPTLDTVQFWLY